MPWQVELRHPLVLVAPAKVNLGLEVLGRRPDGYHDVVTILQTISCFDRIVLRPAPTLHYTPPPAIGRDDLVQRALDLLTAAGVRLQVSIHLTKVIPIAAGLGGGSSDAGTLLGALQYTGVSRTLLDEIARTLGSDVPFFLAGGTALARGRGTELEPLPTPSRWLVVAVPPLNLSAKTATLYGRLSPADYSDGHSTLAQAERLRHGQELEPTHLRNAFARTLLEWPACRALVDQLAAAGATTCWPSGAGPAWFTVTEQWCAAWRLTWLLRQQGITAFPCHTVGADVNRPRAQAAFARCS
jgi:4-diphosphocytidyl-2-C-methyl-D-erythritol kinase